MAFEIQGKVGPQLSVDGLVIDPRLARDGTVVTQDAHGRFQEAVTRGNVYTAANAAAGVTLASTSASPLAAGTGVPIIGLYNPAGSQVKLVVLRVKIAQVSGTPGGGFAWNVIPATGSTITAASTQGLNNLTFAAGGQAKVYNFTAITGSTAASMFRPIGGPAAIALGAGVNSVEEITDGDIVIMPGCFAGIACTAAGTTNIVSAGVTWEEVALAL